MVQLSGGIGNITTNTGLVEMAMAYSRSRVLCAAARLGVADALGDEVRSVGFLAEKCPADANALYRLLRALASIGVTEETTPEHPSVSPICFRIVFGKIDSCLSPDKSPYRTCAQRDFTCPVTA